MSSIKIKDILKKKNREPIICLTSYSKTTAKILDKYCDIILSWRFTRYGFVWNENN